MDSKFKIITGFVILTLIIWVIMFVLDHFFPHASLLGHLWHALVAVIPASTVYIIIALRAYNRRKLAERELRESEERYINAEKIGHFGHWSRYFNESKPTWSEGTYHIFGVDPDKYEPKYPDMLELVHPSDWELSKREVNNAKLHGKKFDIEYRIIRPDGEERIIHSVADVYRDKNGKPEKLFGTLQDITERKQAEEELRKFKTITDNAGYGVAIGNLEGKLLYVNNSFAQMHGYAPIELINLHYSVLYPEEQLATIQRLREQLMQTGSFIAEEVWHVRKDGTFFPTLMTGHLMRDEKGNPLYIVGTTIDITEHKRIEEQLRQSQLLASLGQMTAGIAHEVNNPLSSILLYSELLLAGDIPREATKDLRAIHNEAKRAARIMTDLLTYSRKVEPKIHRVDLHKVLRKVINMRQYREKVQNINAFTYFHEVPLHVKGDANQLMQVFMNLMVNAEEALSKSGGGNITLTTRTYRQWAKVSIADNGTGISEENLNQVFHPFFTTKPTGQGTGLGLSTSYGIVTNHGESIHAENNDMGGATFTVELPLTKARGKISST